MKVQQVFDMAIHLMDEQQETNGETKTVDTQEYQYRTISIINTIIPELYNYSSNYKTGTNGRPVPPFLKVGKYSSPDFTQEIDIDESLCAALLPLYLAAQLLASENAELSQWFMARYQASYYEIRNRIPARFEPIPAPYGFF